MSVMPYYRPSYFDKKPFELERIQRDFFSKDLFPRDIFGTMDLHRPWLWDRDYPLWDDTFKRLDRWSPLFNNLNINDGSAWITGDKDKFQVNVDVKHFAPEDISVKVANGEVTIEGRHEEKRADRDCYGYVNKQFQKKYTLPEGCLPSAVHSNLSSDGVLTVTAPRWSSFSSPGEKVVPIRQTGRWTPITDRLKRW